MPEEKKVYLVSTRGVWPNAAVRKFLNISPNRFDIGEDGKDLGATGDGTRIQFVTDSNVKSVVLGDFGELRLTDQAHNDTISKLFTLRDEYVNKRKALRAIGGVAGIAALAGVIYAGQKVLTMDPETESRLIRKFQSSRKKFKIWNKITQRSKGKKENKKPEIEYDEEEEKEKQDIQNLLDDISQDEQEREENEYAFDSLSFDNVYGNESSEDDDSSEDEF